MFVAIIITLLIIAVAAGFTWMIFSSRRENVTGWVAESVKDWRSEELNVDDFEVEVKDANIGEVFSAFETTVPAYYTPADVEHHWGRVVSAEQQAVSQITSRFRKEEAAAEEPAQPSKGSVQPSAVVAESDASLVDEEPEPRGVAVSAAPVVEQAAVREETEAMLAGASREEDVENETGLQMSA